MKNIFLYLLFLISFLFVSSASSTLVCTGDSVCKPYKPLVVQISTEFASGSQNYGFGFIVGEDNGHFYIVTANHVVRKRKNSPEKDKANILLRFFWDPGDVVDGAKLLDILHKELDLALIRINKDKIFKAAQVAWTGQQVWCDQWQKHEQAWFIGRNRGWYVPPDREGIMLGTEADLQGFVHADIRKVKPGTSGAPLLTKNGIVGMVVTDSGDETRAVDINLIRRFISVNNPYPWNLEKCSSESKMASATSLPIPQPELSVRSVVQERKPESKSVTYPSMIESLAGMELIRIPKGCFQMGSPLEEKDRSEDEGPVRKVCVDEFQIGKHEVTQKEWREVMGENPAHFKEGDDHPVEGISWVQVNEFIDKLNGATKMQFRLPTEAEWEYACRGNRRNTYCGGDHTNLAWYEENSGAGTNPVGSRQANGFGLYDMSGNVWEWCGDWYQEGFYKVGPQDNPLGAPSGSERVVRGGSWMHGSKELRGGNRGKNAPTNSGADLGFRLVLSNRPLIHIQNDTMHAKASRPPEKIEENLVSQPIKDDDQLVKIADKNNRKELRKQQPPSPQSVRAELNTSVQTSWTA
ncbi:MAG: hypothetical protein D3923_11100, partial [Candidatus Electrothrix sp. AR3]|nr:hypothetical protein [Candidatus Electrothrix sp. AR3]